MTARNPPSTDDDDLTLHTLSLSLSLSLPSPYSRTFIYILIAGLASGSRAILDPHILRAWAARGFATSNLVSTF